MQTKIDFKKSLLRCLVVLLAVAVTVTMTPVNMEKAYAGSADTVLTVNGTAYTKAQLLEMESVVDTFSYIKKDVSYTDVVKGVSLKSLLKDSDLNHVVEFGTVDNAPQYVTRNKMTVQELIASDAILAYMCGENESSLKDIEDKNKDGNITGYLRLYTKNNEKYDKLINSITVSENVNAGENNPSTGEEATYVLKVKGDAAVAEKNYTLDNLKDTNLFEKIQNTKYSWTNKVGTSDSTEVTGVTVKSIIKAVGIKTNFAQITFEAADDGYKKTFDVKDMYVADMDKLYPLVAWKVDGNNDEGLTFVIGKKNAEDKNKSSWVSDVKTIVISVKDGTLSAPASIKATRASYNSVKLTWKAVDGADGYCVEKYDSKAKAFKEVGNVTANTKTITKLNTGTEYKFRVKAYYSVDGAKTYSKATASAKATPSLSKPAITKLTAGSKKITVKWTKVDGANGYKIYRATSKSGKYKPIKTLKSGKTTYYTNKSLTKGKKYYYKVKAYRTVGSKTVSSSYSAVKYARAK